MNNNTNNNCFSNTLNEIYKYTFLIIGNAVQFDKFKSKAISITKYDVIQSVSVYNLSRYAIGFRLNSCKLIDL